MKVFIDANLLIYLNTITNTTVRRLYEIFYFDLLRKYKAYTDVLVLDELIYISRKKYGIPYQVSLSFIESAIRPYVNILNLREDEYEEAAETLSKYNIKPSDALHLGVMKKNNITYIASEDTEYDKINWIKRLWLTE
ncbi:MAG: PIN domain nuclease [Thermoprotei archaeon]|nr:MAG: PIN domain nuclease [Thermoprotei archaeon]